MSLKDAIHNAMIEVGILKKDASDFLKNETPKIVAFFGNAVKYLAPLQQLADNPQIDTIAALVIGAPVETAIKAGIDFAMGQLYNGSSIAADVAAATTPEAKFIIAYKDMLKYFPGTAKMKIGDIAALVAQYVAKNGGYTISINAATQAIEAEIGNLAKAA